MVSVATYCPAKTGARMARILTASVVPLRRNVRVALELVFKDGAPGLLDGVLARTTENRMAPTTNATMTAIKIMRFNRTFRAGRSGDAPSSLRGGEPSVITSALDEYMP